MSLDAEARIDPLTRPAAASGTASSGQPGPIPGCEDLGGSTVVVVDDQPANVLLLERLLKRAGIGQVVGVTDPRAGLERCLADPPDLLLLDLRMPHLDGVTFLHRLRAGLPAETFLPVLVLTADTAPHAKEAALTAGATDFLTKPFDSIEVLLRVRNLLQARALYTRVQHLVVVEDRERIAADLHDTVIQRLFGVGLALEAARPLASPELAERIRRAVVDLDETIRELRSSIFALQQPPSGNRGLRSQVLALASEAAVGLGFEPHVRLDGPLDSDVRPDVAEQLVPMLREALSNVVRHAGAGRVGVTVAVSPSGELVATVADDGVGLVRRERPGGRGVGNMARRAENLGGTATVEPRPDTSGTVVTWRVPEAGYRRSTDQR
jgi:signal transduction histidine kinase